MERIGYFGVDKSMTKASSFAPKKNGSARATLVVGGAINIPKKVFASWLPGPRSVVYRLLIVRWRRNCRVSRAFFETSPRSRTTESSAKTVPPLIHSTRTASCDVHACARVIQEGFQLECWETLCADNNIKQYKLHVFTF